MANDAFSTIRDCQSCAKAHGTLTKSKKHLRLFPANGPFKFEAMEIIGPLQKTNQSGKRFIMVIKDRYSKLTREMPMNETTTPLVSACFMNNWLFPYGIPNSILTDNGRSL